MANTNNDDPVIIKVGNQIWFGWLAFFHLSSVPSDKLKPQFALRGNPNDAAPYPAWSLYTDMTMWNMNM